jgi:hypothetical protein
MKAQNRVFFLGVLCLLLLGFLPTMSAGQTVHNHWTLDKFAWKPGKPVPPNLPVSVLTLSVGQPFVINYTITVSLQDPSKPPDADDQPCSINVYDYTPFPSIVLGTIDLCGSSPDLSKVPWTYTYPATLQYNECGVYQVKNTAYICNGTYFTWTIDVNVPCGGCTLTPGYWKTHSEYGPAPYDETWALLSNGANTAFFGSGQTWYDVLWTPPAKGNPYYILAHAYIAAKLNILNGASTTSDINDALSWAEAWFGANSPGSYANRQAALNRATILDNYNNGLIGPGHCSEEGIS